MKNLLLLFIILHSFTSLYSQQFQSLDGIESSSGQTLLLYRLGSEEFYQFNPIFKYNPSTDFEMKIMEAYAIEYPTSADVKAVSDFEFFKNDTINFVNTGFRVIMDLNGYSAINDSFRFFYFGPIELVEISSQDPQKVFISDLSATFRSFDGGNTFPQDSILLNGNFSFLSLCDFDDKNWFGLNEEGELFKTNAGTVDTSKIIYDRYLNFYYDINQYYVYRVNKTYGGYSLNVSNNKGNAFTWTKTYQSENPIFISIDSTQSGAVYLADGKQVYKSTNNGYNFNPYKSLPRNLVGLYKKPNSEILYAASKYQLYEIRPDTTIIIKSVQIPGYVFDWFPLAINNKWIYEVTILDENCSWSVDQYYERNIITKDTLINGQTFFKFEPALAFNYQFIRIDSTEGKLLAISPFDSNPVEIAIYDFLMELGDTVLFTPIEPFGGFTLVNQEAQFIFGENRSVNDLMALGFLPPSYSLIYRIGYYRDSFCEFGGHRRELVGCVIDDVVYGDTIFTDVDDELNLLPTEYKLEQNYPNPFNPSTKISWQSPVAGWQTLRVYDVLGNEVATLVNEYRNAGSYEVEFNVAQESLPAIANGVYFYRLQAGEFVQTKKMILLK